MNVHTPITPAVRVRLKLPPAPDVSPATQKVQQHLPRLKGAIAPLSAQARAALFRCLRRDQKPESETIPARASRTEHNLLRIATRYSRAELLALHGVRLAGVGEIEAWLIAHGRRFCSDPPSLQDALTQALAHIEAMLEAKDDGAFLAAYVALPDLRRGLDLQASQP